MDWAAKARWATAPSEMSLWCAYLPSAACVQSADLVWKAYLLKYLSMKGPVSASIARSAFQRFSCVQGWLPTCFL